MNAEERDTNRVLRFLVERSDEAFTQYEICEGTDVDALKISAVLSRLEARGLVRQDGNDWTLGEADEIATYLGMSASTRTANDRFREEDMAEWLDHAVDEVSE